jgi:hypothetical protein
MQNKGRQSDSATCHFCENPHKKRQVATQLMPALEEKMEISNNFNQLSFHDASIESVLRVDDCIEIMFDFVVVAPEHPAAKGEVVELKEAKVIFKKIKAEKALIWHDDKSPINHPNPNSPVNEVMHGTQKEGYFHFDGFWQPDDWSEWFIYSDTFIVSGRAVEFSRAAF